MVARKCVNGLETGFVVACSDFLGPRGSQRRRANTPATTPTLSKQNPPAITPIITTSNPSWLFVSGNCQ